ncbi:MAG: FtsX-like permease family protein [Bifidobacteriaceae bacterium]|jgi:putative ABC transport system permease protein|nr:FtsX-like permease family protein [Bifidobacteriaceae bacterium]
MFRLTLKNAKAHLGKFILSIVAVALGTSFIVATFCFQTMINSTVDSAYASSQNADVFVRGPVNKDASSALSFGSGLTSSRQSINANLVDDIKKVPGVLMAYPNINRSITLVGKDNKPVHSLGQVMVRGITDNFLQFSNWKLLNGGLPNGDNEIILEKQTADIAHLSVGDTTKVVDDSGPRDVKITGILEAPSHTPGELLIGMSQTTVEKKYLVDDMVSQIAVWGKSGISQIDLAKQVQQYLPANSKAEAVTGNVVREEGSKNIKDNIGFVQNFIIIFAIIALFVGCFIIANTFSMIVQESLREYAVLRAIGASIRQVWQIVILQALVIGLFGSLLGIILGSVLIQIIPAILSVLGSQIDTIIYPNPSQIAIVFFIGIVVSLAAAIFPARKAGSVSPIAAMTEAVLPVKLGKIRVVFGFLFLFIGLPCLIIIDNYDWFISLSQNYFFNDYKTYLAGVGSAAVTLSALLLAPLIIRPLVWLLSLPIVWVSKVGGKLARNNIIRSFKASANTASALLIGIALVSCCAVLASSAQSSVASMVNNNIKADLVVIDENLKLPETVADKIVTNSAVDKVDNLYMTQLKVNNKPLPIIGIDKTFFTRDIDINNVPYTGDPIYAINHNEIVLPKMITEANNYHLGQMIKIYGVDNAKLEAQKKQTASEIKQKLTEFAMANMKQPSQSDIDVITKQVTSKNISSLPTKAYNYKIGAIVDTYLLLGVVMNNVDFDKLTVSNQRFLLRLFVNLKPNNNLDVVKNQLQNSVKDFYTVSVLDKSGLNNMAASIINIILGLLYGLLALSVLIALLGIVNTLTLSVVQRTREIGLLKAIGLSNAGLTLMLGVESLLIAVFGILVGITIGINAAVAIQKALSSSGFSALSIPYGQILIFVGLGAGFAILACLFPARRAKKMPILDAIAAE